MVEFLYINKHATIYYFTVTYHLQANDERLKYHIKLTFAINTNTKADISLKLRN